MKKLNYLLILGFALLVVSCNNPNAPASAASTTEEKPGAGQSAVKDDVSAKNIVQVAVGSKDHTTLVTALQKAEYVDVLANAGPFTVFAPTNAAFDKLPAGTVENLIKPENKATLRDILEYHVSVGVYNPDQLQDGQKLNQANSQNVTISVNDGKIKVNDANVVTTVRTSNGIIYIVDGVLLPPKK